MKNFLKSKKGLIVTTIIFGLFITLVLPYFSNLTTRITNSNFSPDTGFFYSPDTFYANMELYGKEGRNFYVLMRWTFDIVWPIVYTSFFLSILVFFTNIYEGKTKQKILYMPFLAVGFDFIENILATINVSIYPSKSIATIILMQISSTLKWIVILCTSILIIILIILYFISKKRTNQV